MIAFLYRLILVAFSFALFVPCLAIADDAPSDEIKNAAKDGIKIFLKDSQLSDRKDFGFKIQSDIDNAEIGEAFQVFTIDTDKLLDTTSAYDFQSLVIPTNRWEFLVHTGGNVKTLLSVSRSGTKWIPSGMGSSKLAEEMSGFLAVWPKSAGYSFRFIKLILAKTFFIEVSQEGKVIGIIPLTNLLTDIHGRKTGEFGPADLHEPQEILLNLRDTVKQYLKK